MEIEGRYDAYLNRQAADNSRDEELKIPADTDFSQIGGLSNEVRNYPREGRQLCAASGSGVTPAALTALPGTSDDLRDFL